MYLYFPDTPRTLTGLVKGAVFVWFKKKSPVLLKISNLIEDVIQRQTVTKKVQETYAVGHRDKLGLVDVP